MKKCIVLDLDNTLWGGIVGEDGIENLALSVAAPGNSFLAFQQALLDHYDRGIILAINSRNNPNDAWEVIRTHPNMILKEHHFAAHRMNWQDKSENMKELAKELNIGLDSMVFLDDDPTNRELVRALVPEVEVPELPQDPADYASFLHSLPYFESQVITDEDKMRGNLYVTERLRKEAERTYETKEEYLASLRLKFFIHENDASCLPRLSQLTEKTNQFNVHKKPMTEDEIRAYCEDPGRGLFYGRLLDVFGDYGVITLALIEKSPEEWHISTLLMSCRVFGRGVEEAFFSCIVERAREVGVQRITVNFVPSEKNMPAKDFVDRYFVDGVYTMASKLSEPSWMTLQYEKNV